MAVGTFKFFNTQKGYGFITPSDGGKDVFVHISAVERSGMAGLANHDLEPWANVVTVLVWAAVSFVVGALLLQRRDA